MTSRAPYSKAGCRPWSGISFASSRTTKSAYSTASSSVFHTAANASLPSRLITIKVGGAGSDFNRSDFNVEREQALHHRLHKIDSIFSNETFEVLRQSMEIDSAFGSMPGTRPRSEGLTGAELPHWVLTPSSRAKQSKVRLEPIVCSDDEEGPDLAFAAIVDTQSLQHSGIVHKRSKCQTSPRKPSKGPSMKEQRDRLLPIRSPLSHSRRHSTNADGIVDEATDEWVRHVRKQGCKLERRISSRRRSSLSIEKEVHAEGGAQNSTWTRHFAAGSRKTTPVNKLRRALLRAPHSTGQVKDALNSLSEKQVLDLLRRASRSRMELLNEMPVIVDVFKLGGYPYLVDVDWLEEIVSNKTQTSHLDHDDFTTVWRVYFERLTEFHTTVFMKAAEGKSVVVDSVLPGMFRELGFWPMPGALAEACSRMVPLQRLPNGITLTDFHRIYNDLYSRAGLTLNEYTKACDIFNQHATKDQTFRPYSGNVDRLDAKNIVMALRKLQPHFLLTKQEPVILTPGFNSALAKELVEQVAERRLTLDANAWRPVLERLLHVPVDDAQAGLVGTIDKTEFLVACNMMHQRIAERVSLSVERIGLTVATKFTQDDVTDLFDELGHVCPSFDVLFDELLEECDLVGVAELSFAQVYIVLLAYCEVDGLSVSQREEMSRLFDLFQTKLPDVERQDDKLRISEMKRALRWMCYTPSQHRMITFMDACDKNNMDYMDLEEFMEIVSDYRYVSLGMARPAFRTTLDSGNGNTRCVWTTVEIDNLDSLLRSVGHHCSADEVTALTKEARQEDGEISWREFLRLEEFHRNAIKEKLKENLGHTDVEIELLKKDYEARLVPHKDYIIYEGLAKIIKKHMPRMPMDDEVRRLVKESDLNGNHLIEFNEFLWIMRRLSDKDSKIQLDRAQRAIEELGYTHEEVRDMRELFNYTDTDLSGTLDIDELNVLFAGLVEMSHEAEIELHMYLDQVDTHHHGELDFWEFLRLMKTLEQQNWRNILGAAASQVRQEEKDKQAANNALESSARKSVFIPGGVGHHMML